jgi:hypothetical protein
MYVGEVGRAQELVWIVFFSDGRTKPTMMDANIWT